MDFLKISLFISLLFMFGCSNSNLGNNSESFDEDDFSQESVLSLDGCLSIDSSLNGRVDGTQERLFCITDSLKNIESSNICNYFLEYEKEVCIKTAQDNGNDPKFCDLVKLGTSDEFALCSTYYAAKLKDESFCDKLDELIIPHRKGMCLNALARYSEDSTYCDKITFPNAERDQNICFTNLAFKTGDISYCENLNDLSLKSTCELKSELFLTHYDKYLEN